MKISPKELILAERIRKHMVCQHLTLSTAESCTSGRIAAILTSVRGASDYYQGGMVVYQDELKTRFLGVSSELIAEHDVVSEAVVRQMAIGCLHLYHTDFSICSTGYTGGGSERVPAGTVWLAIGKRNDSAQPEVITLCLTGDAGRENNTAAAARAAISRLAQLLAEREP